MYSTEELKQVSHKHILSLLVKDEPGVMTRISGMFLKRNFNISTISVGQTTRQGISRINLSFHGDDRMYDQIYKQLSKIIDVLKVESLPEKKSVIREIALIKVRIANVNEQNQVMNYCHTYRAKVLGINHEQMIVEVTGKPDKVDSFIALLNNLGIIEISRSGVIAMHREKDDFEKIDE